MKIAGIEVIGLLGKKDNQEVNELFRENDDFNIPHSPDNAEYNPNIELSKYGKSDIVLNIDKSKQCVDDLLAITKII